MNKLEVTVYGIISDACHRAEKGDRQWRKDPNHFLLDYTNRILKYQDSQGESLIKEKHD